MCHIPTPGESRIPPWRLRKAAEPVTKARRSNRIAVQRLIANRVADDAANTNIGMYPLPNEFQGMLCPNLHQQSTRGWNTSRLH